MDLGEDSDSICISHTAYVRMHRKPNNGSPAPRLSAANDPHVEQARPNDVDGTWEYSSQIALISVVSIIGHRSTTHKFYLT